MRWGSFEKHYSEGKKANEDGEYHPAWQEYGQYARTNADSSASIRRRQNYFTARMVEYLGDSLIPLDTQRLFNDVEKRYMYWRDSGDCQVCRMPTPVGEFRISPRNSPQGRRQDCR